MVIKLHVQTQGSNDGLTKAGGWRGAQAPPPPIGKHTARTIGLEGNHMLSCKLARPNKHGGVDLKRLGRIHML